ncbi:hypothetical protein ACHAXS_008463 [Conticribra weissflogii]
MTILRSSSWWPVLVAASLRSSAWCFSVPPRVPGPAGAITAHSTILQLSSDGSRSHSQDVASVPPQAFASGYSTHPDLLSAIDEAVLSALSSLPPPHAAAGTFAAAAVDLAVVSASSLYEEPSKIVPSLLEAVARAADRFGYSTVRHVVGGTAGGVVGSRSDSRSDSRSGNDAAAECVPFEAEATPCVSVTLALLPEVEIRPFRLTGDDVPDGLDAVGRRGREVWMESVGLGGFGMKGDGGVEEEDDDPVFMVIPSPAFQNDLDDFLRGLQYAFPNGQTFGGIASTVSSLSRARLFCHSSHDDNGNENNLASSSSSPAPPSVYGDGCVGVALRGDIRVDTMIAQGAKPVGGVYRVVAVGRNEPGSRGTKANSNSNNPDDDDVDDGSRSTIGAIVLDEAATAEEELGYTDDDLSAASGNDDDDDDNDEADAKAAKRAQLAADYAKARIPKPPLAEANFLMRRLSDDDQAFMRRALLIGLERGGSIGKTPNELMRLAKGEGHRFTVRQVASAGMKDGSVTFPLGSVNVEVGARCRFFVRDGEFAKKEVEALWTGYKKRELTDTLNGKEVSPVTGCMVFPTLDRGSKLFGGKAGYESGVISTFLPGVPSISGFYANGVLGKLDGTVGGVPVGPNENMLHGSASCYVMFRSKTKRPFFSPKQATIDAADAAAAEAEAKAAEMELAAEDEKRSTMSKSSFGSEGRVAPRSSDGELIVRRREIHSGRSLSVSTVEWSVAEKMAKPTSALEGFMWEKETQVDRQRERIPLALLMSQCKAAMMDPSKPKPRDWIGPVKRAGADGKFVIIPECKRMEPTTGSLRKRYDLPKLVKQLTKAGAPSISVNSDSVLFGGSLEDITKAREASAAAAATESLDSDDGVVAPPVLASDLLLYPYQLYKLRLAGADAVNLVVGALDSKDLIYLTKIASTLQLQVVASVTSEAQIELINKLGAGSICALAVSNRELENFDFDTSGEQALNLLRSDALAAFREKHGAEVPVLVEGRVGMIEADGDETAYIRALKDAGAFGAIVAGGIALRNEDNAGESIHRWSL